MLRSHFRWWNAPRSVSHAGQQVSKSFYASIKLASFSSSSPRWWTRRVPRWWTRHQDRPPCSTHRSGEVLFLAGAGVSAPSKLPLFEGLTLGVYKSLGDPLFDILAKAKKRRRVSGREKVISEANLSPDKQVEANLFFERQYDRLFSALEKRVDPDLRALR
jgi:hypothetical protein